VTKDVGSYSVILRALGRRKLFSFMMDVLKGMVAIVKFVECSEWRQ
jgi:pentatricopeptide repeat protein